MPTRLPAECPVSKLLTAPTVENIGWVKRSGDWHSVLLTQPFNGSLCLNRWKSKLLETSEGNTRPPQSNLPSPVTPATSTGFELGECTICSIFPWALDVPPFSLGELKGLKKKKPGCNELKTKHKIRQKNNYKFFFQKCTSKLQWEEGLGGPMKEV